MFRSTSRRVALATEGTQESLSLSHFDGKIRLPRGPVNFFSWARIFLLSNQQCKGTALWLRYSNSFGIKSRVFRDNFGAGQNGQGQNGQNRKINCQNPSL